MRELSLHLLDVLQNAREADASTVWMTIEESPARDLLTITIEDNGRGMSEETMRKALDPFFTSRKTRHVGLGLPLFAAAAERCGGGLRLQSVHGQGTRVSATFGLSHIDRAPLGDMTGTVLSFLLGDPPCDLVYLHRRNGRQFCLDSRKVREELGRIPLQHAAVRDWLREYLTQEEERLASCETTD